MEIIIEQVHGIQRFGILLQQKGWNDGLFYLFLLFLTLYMTFFIPMVALWMGAEG